jgi:hypothetical protein
MSQFQTFKSDLTHSRIVDTDSVSIHDDEIAVKIESFAFTANNVTYGVRGRYDWLLEIFSSSAR